MTIIADDLRKNKQEENICTQEESTGPISLAGAGNEAFSVIGPPAFQALERLTRRVRTHIPHPDTAMMLAAIC